MNLSLQFLTRSIQFNSFYMIKWFDCSEIATTLKMFGISATEDMDMVAQIKSEVRKLCTRNNIASQITINEKDERKKENLARLIYETQKELEVNS